jgi:hypothetical protein
VSEQHQDARVSPVPLKKSHLSPSVHFLERPWKACRMESQVRSEENPFLGGSSAQLRARNREFEPSGTSEVGTKAKHPRNPRNL